MNSPSDTRPRTVAVAGATGLVGRRLVQRLCADPRVGVVHALVRRPLTEMHPKLQPLVVDFAALPALPPIDEVYLALGTTIKVAGSQAAFRAVDFDANLAVAHAALAAGARRAGLVSALGASAQSPVFYNRVKGELEDALAALPFDRLVIAQPSLLLGDRASLGQPERHFERWMRGQSSWLAPLIPRHWRPIAAADVAAALAATVPMGQGLQRFSSAAMQGASTV